MAKKKPSKKQASKAKKSSSAKKTTKKSTKSEVISVELPAREYDFIKQISMITGVSKPMVLKVIVTAEALRVISAEDRKELADYSEEE